MASLAGPWADTAAVLVGVAVFGLVYPQARGHALRQAREMDGGSAQAAAGWRCRRLRARG